MDHGSFILTPNLLGISLFPFAYTSQGEVYSWKYTSVMQDILCHAVTNSCHMYVHAVLIAVHFHYTCTDNSMPQLCCLRCAHMYILCTSCLCR